MVVLNKIYTKRGDDGKTELGNGERVKKFSKRVEAYGTVDELNSLIGIVTSLDIDKDLKNSLLKIQNDLFDIGADLCVPKDDNNNFSPFRFPSKYVLRLENEIDLMNSSIEPIKSFVLPGGSRVSSQLHLCRTTCRRAERYVVELMEKRAFPSSVFSLHFLCYLHEISPFFIFSYFLPFFHFLRVKEYLEEEFGIPTCIVLILRN